MRMSGVTESVRGFGPHDHLCWAYDEPGEFRSRALEFLVDGLAQGQRVRCVTDGDTAGLWDDLRSLDGTSRDRRPAAVGVEPPDALYVTGAVVDPVRQVEVYAAATEDALAAGFTGLRVAGDATPWVRTAEQLDAFARYEHLVDRYMAHRPFSGLCAYNRAELGQDTIAQLACLHPTVHNGTTSFRLHASIGAAVSLSGELDYTSRELFALALRRADLWPAGGELVIDGTDLAFIDHRSVRVLADYARGCDATAVLRTGLATTPRIVELLDLKNMRVEVST